MSIAFEPPGPGHWALDRSHLPLGCTPLIQGIMTESEPPAMRRLFRDLGAPLDTIDVGFVHGAMYTRVRPLLGADKPSARQPPRWLMWLGVRLHPEMRRRNRTAGVVQQEEPWKQVIADWHTTTKPQVEAANLALQDVDLPALDGAGLMGHLRDCYEHCVRNWDLHFWLHGYDLGPLGQYLFEASSWGIPATELLSLLEGASPSTTGPARECAAIRAMVAASGAEPTTLSELTAVSSDVALAVERYLRPRRWVLFSRYDLDGIAFGERSDLVFAAIMAGEERDTSAEVAARTAAVRARVPVADRARFDEVLRQARDAMDLRDDNGPTTAEWPAGLLRRALLEAGRRLQEGGHVADPALALEITPTELRATPLPEGLPAGAVLAERRAARSAQSRLDPPRTLGPAEPPPPEGLLPPAMNRLAGTTQLVLQHLGMDGAGHAHALAGAGIGAVSVRAVACVAVSPEDALDRIEPGQVLVVAATTPAYNLVLSLAGGVVTAEGGPMSHAAVLARELGIPAVIGARGALTEIPHGALIEVDPVAGEVRLVP